MPTVLDGWFSEAFCPAPKGERVGRVVDLSSRLENPLREVVHPFVRYRAEHLFRVGYIHESVPHDLGEARAAHILYLREERSRPSYAVGTDGDLI